MLYAGDYFKVDFFCLLQFFELVGSVESTLKDFYLLDGLVELLKFKEVGLFRHADHVQEDFTLLFFEHHAFYEIIVVFVPQDACTDCECFSEESHVSVYKFEIGVLAFHKGCKVRPQEFVLLTYRIVRFFYDFE